MTLPVRNQDPDKRLEAERVEVQRIERRIAELDGRINGLLLADDNGAIEKLETDIAALRKEADRRRRLIGVLEDERANAEKAAVLKRREAQINRVENLCTGRTNLGPKIEKKIEELLDLVVEEIDYTKRIIPAWTWSNSDREVLKPFGQGIRELLCYEFFRQSASRFIGQTGAVTLPGSVCEKDIWRLQPHLIPKLSDRLREIGDYASRAMRGVNLPLKGKPDERH